MNFILKQKKYFVIASAVLVLFVYQTETVSAYDSFFAIPSTDSSFALSSQDSTFATQSHDSSFAVPSQDSTFAQPSRDSSFAQPSTNSGFVLASKPLGGSASVSINTRTPISTSNSNTNLGSYYQSFNTPYNNYNYGSYSGYPNYTSSYSYAATGSTYTPTWKPNTGGWKTDYQLGYSTAESAPSTSGGDVWNPDTSGWTTDYQLTYGTNANGNYRVICSVDDTTVESGDKVKFSARATGGSDDYEYEWFGDDGIDSTKQKFSHEFDRNGIYHVSVEVTDADGYKTYDDCDTVYVGRDYYTTNYVQDYGYNGGDLAGANSVYLSQVPYTGAQDTAKVIGFVALLVVWSSAVGYFLIKRKSKNKVSNRIADFKKANLAARA